MYFPEKRNGLWEDKIGRSTVCLVNWKELYARTQWVRGNLLDKNEDVCRVQKFVGYVEELGFILIAMISIWSLQALEWSFQALKFW